MTELKTWQLILLLLLVPPVGVYAVCARGDVHWAYKLLAVVYCAALVLFLMLLRAPLGRVVINAERIQ